MRHLFILTALLLLGACNNENKKDEDSLIKSSSAKVIGCVIKSMMFKKA